MDRDGVTRARRGGPRWWRLVLAAAVLVEAARCLPALGLDDVAVECPPAFADGCGMPCRVLDPLGQDPLWSGRTEALLPWRSSPQSLPLFETVAGTPALDAADFGSGMAAGPRFSLFRHTGDTGAIEFTFLRVQSFQ